MQVAAGLSAVHKQKLVHRDIKPSNIMVNVEEDGTLTAKIIDLGLAKPTNNWTENCLHVGLIRKNLNGFVETMPVVEDGRRETLVRHPEKRKSKPGTGFRSIFVTTLNPALPLPGLSCDAHEPSPPGLLLFPRNIVAWAGKSTLINHWL
jgi:serine/threonine protein kinase